MKKSTIGIGGFDALTGGGLPRGRVTLVEGGAGTGKTLFALQTLVHGARDLGEPGIFVAFEESARQITANAAEFGWDIPALERDKLFFLDAQPDPNLGPSGDFDLTGMLAGLEAKIAAIGAKRIVFDAIDIVLALLPDTAAVRREAFRLHNWLLQQELTALITAKSGPQGAGVSGLPPLEFMQFMVDCAVRLDHDMVDGVSQRSLHVRKYRGSGFDGNATPYMFGSGGMEVAHSVQRGHPDVPASSERLSSGIDELDDMLSGGYFRGACVLLTGAPGTAKTTLCGAFAEASCRRGDRTLFISFDSRSDEIVRNLDSVAIKLADYVDSGHLRMMAMRALGGSAESHLMRIKLEARDHGARCVIIDPLSALAKSGNRGTAPGVGERLVDWAKAEGMTVLCSSLLDDAEEPTEGTPLQISTIADTWIHLSYLVHAGERNRGLSIIKSRGTGHSNQVRELLLGNDGVRLMDVYTAGGEVLMGTLRWERERQESIAASERKAVETRDQNRLQMEASALEAQIANLKNQLEANRSAEAALMRRSGELSERMTRSRKELRDRREGGPSSGRGGRQDER